MDIIKKDLEFFIGDENDKKAYISFIKNNNLITIEHTVIIDNSLKGKGIGSGLVKEVIKFARENNYKVNATCWFADEILKREEYSDIYSK